MPMPIEGVYAMVQTNMSATLNIDWLLDIALDIIKPYNSQLSRDDLIAEVGAWIDSSTAGQLVYHPYISNAGERGPFIDSNARAGFVGLSSQHRFADLVRGVVEGLAYAARDCYEAMGTVPGEIRLTGGASKSAAVRAIFGNVLGSNITTSERKEAGAAGAAMMAAVNIGQYATMDDCVTAWVTPHLGVA